MGSAMTYVIEMSAAIIAVAFIIPIAFSYLFNGSSWGETPAVVVTLGTTVLGIFCIIGLMLKFMPSELRARVGL